MTREKAAAFVTKWRNAALKERASAQEHFIDLCRLLGEPTPAEADAAGAWYCFEKGAKKAGGGDGWADVWKRGCFGWEYKGKGQDLQKAFGQLQNYAPALEYPPLLRVTVWIGELQWMLGHGFSLARNPILKPLETIAQCDALLISPLPRGAGPGVRGRRTREPPRPTGPQPMSSSATPRSWATRSCWARWGTTMSGSCEPAMPDGCRAARTW